MVKYFPSLQSFFPRCKKEEFKVGEKYGVTQAWEMKRVIIRDRDNHHL